MADELSVLLNAPGGSRKQITCALVDEKLCFLTSDVELSQWVEGPTTSIEGHSITELLPELRGKEETLERLLNRPDEVFTLSAVPRPATGKPSRYFDLQIEAAPGQENTLILLLADTTEETALRQHLSQLAGQATPQSPLDPTELEARNRVLLLLNQAGRILTATLEMEQVLERLLQVATQIIGAEGSSVWLRDDDKPEYLVCRAAFHPGSESTLVDQRIRSGEGIAGWVAQTGESTIVAETIEDQRFSPLVDARSGLTTASIIAVPLQLRDKVIGVLEVVNKVEAPFNLDDLAVAETLAASASIAIDNAHLVEALQKQMDDLQERNQELDAFDHTVAHDLQNPLALIVGFADVLKRDGEVSPAEQQQALDTIVKNAQKLSNIVQELLILASVRKSEVQTQPVAMRPLVHSALERLAHLIQEYNVEIILPQFWPLVMGHSPWIEEVWENYISNAIKHGGRPPRIELGARSQPDGTVTYWVHDNGPGLTPEQQAMLFTPFTRLSEIRVTGHGLGLSIVRRIIEKLGGQVGIESEGDQGSLFTFTLPGVEQESEDGNAANLHSLQDTPS